MPYRSTFDCLWCGTPHRTRGPDDLEGWAQLCPTCIGRAGDNGFLRARLRRGMDERARTREAPAVAPEVPRGRDAGVGSDDWYLRRGPHSRGAIADATWAADLDAATLWLDGLPWRGEIVELAAGDGWWSPLLATKGELWCYDANGERLDRARSRLMAHGLQAHLHVRDPWLEPDRRVDGLFTAHWLGRGARERPADALALVRRWLHDGGLVALLDVAETVDHEALQRRLLEAGFIDPAVVVTSSGLVYGRATAGSTPE